MVEMYSFSGLFVYGSNGLTARLVQHYDISELISFLVQASLRQTRLVDEVRAKVVNSDATTHAR